MQKNTYSVFFVIVIGLLITACSYTEKIRDGRTAFDRKQYSVALPMLERAFKKTDSKVEKGKIAFLVAESYKKIGNNSAAITWYKSAMDFQYGIDATKGHANTLKFDEQYALATTAYKELGSEIGSPFEFKKDIEGCQVASKWKNMRTPYLIEKQPFNSTFDDYAAVNYTVAQLVITSDRNGANDKKIYQWTGKNFADLYLVDKKTGTTKPFSTQINSETNEATPTFNADCTEMIFVRNIESEKGDFYTQLLVSKRDAALWSAPEALVFCKNNVNYWQPTLSENALTLIFSSNDSEGFGGFDLYFSTRKDISSDWENPKLLPRNINTVGNEVFPVFDADTLYFSSDYLIGMGGLDIFKTYKTGFMTWAMPQNLRSPINSGADDFSLLIDNQPLNEKDVLQKGFFSSNRKGGMGGDDVYAFKKIVLAPLPPDPKKNQDSLSKIPPKPIVYQLLLEGFILEKIYQKSDDPNSKTLGRKGLSNSIVAINTNNENKKIVTDENGFFSMSLSENTDYQFVGTKEGYLNNSTIFSTKGIGKDPNNPIQKFDVTILLDKIYKNKEIILDNIYYDLDKWDVRIDAQPTLNQLAQTLSENPNIKIQLNAHTDCRGNDTYNQELSQRRAQAAVEYLITKGIAAARLSSQGYGETAPANACACAKCSEIEHQQNRRTTFKIVE